MINKNQWKIINLHTNKVSYLKVRADISNKKSYPRFTNFIKGGLTVLISVLIIFTVVKAGTLTPPSGAISTQTLPDATTTVSAGYYANSTTLDTVDTDLATGRCHWLLRRAQHGQFRRL